MGKTINVRGRYVGKTFIPDGPLPEGEGTADLVITLDTGRPRGSIADAFGSAKVLRSGNEILQQVRDERDEWGDR